MGKICYKLFITMALCFAGVIIFSAIKDYTVSAKLLAAQESPLLLLQGMQNFKNSVAVLTVLFRPLDTLGSILVLLGAVIAILSLNTQENKVDWGQMYESVILSLVSAIFFSLCLVFALYLLFYGMQQLGGGLKGGILLAAGGILFFLAFGHKEFAKKFQPECFVPLGVGGILLFLLVFLGITLATELIGMTSAFLLNLGLLISIGMILIAMFWELAKGERGRD